jgi:DNA-binding HxlR family transcriptional regulator
MDSYGQYCPIARGAEIFLTRWTPIIVRNMLVGCRTFGQILEGAPGISRALLSERLRQLEHYGIMTRSPNPAGRGYLHELTDAGRSFRPSPTRWVPGARAG